MKNRESSNALGRSGKNEDITSREGLGNNLGAKVLESKNANVGHHGVSNE